MVPTIPIRIAAILVRTTRRNVVRDTQATVAGTIPIPIADIRSNVHTAHRSSSVHTAHHRGRILRRGYQDHHHRREAIRRREDTLHHQDHHVPIPRRTVPIPRRAVLQAEPLPAAADHHLVAVRVVAVAAAATAAVHTVGDKFTALQNRQFPRACFKREQALFLTS